MPKIKPQNVVIDPSKSIAYIPVGRYAKNGYVMVDLVDLPLVRDYYWTPDKAGYPRTFMGMGRGSALYMHTILQPTRDGYTVDHINRDIRDNRRSNLREATRREQCINRSVHRNNGRTSKYKGVFFMTRYSDTQKFGRKAYYSWEYALYSIDIPSGSIRGVAKSEKEAAEKYNELAKKYQGDKAVLNHV